MADGSGKGIAGVEFPVGPHTEHLPDHVPHLFLLCPARTDQCLLDDRRPVVDDRHTVRGTRSHDDPARLPQLEGCSHVLRRMDVFDRRLVGGMGADDIG